MQEGKNGIWRGECRMEGYRMTGDNRSGDVDAGGRWKGEEERGRMPSNDGFLRG